MKKFLSRLSELKGMLLVGAIFGLVICLILLVVGLVSGYFGWLYGALVGTTVELINIFLLYKGSEYIVKKMRASLFLIFYFSRMTLYIAVFVLCAFLQFGFGDMSAISEWNYCLWGCLIAISPLQLIVIIVMGVTHKSPISLAENYTKVGGGRKDEGGQE